MTGHSCVISPQFKGALAHVGQGKYGHMFPDLTALEIDEELLLALGRTGSRMDLPTGASDDSTSDNPQIPAGFTFLGQFIAHDITRDPSLLHHARNGELRNFRTPRLDLEAVCGGGPVVIPISSLGMILTDFFLERMSRAAPTIYREIRKDWP